MGIAVANQMATFMSQSLKQMEVPGAGKTIPNNTLAIYYAVIDNNAVGPFSITEIARLIADKKITQGTYVWKPGLAKWDLAINVNEIVSLVALTPPPIPTNLS